MMSSQERPKERKLKKESEKVSTLKKVESELSSLSTSKLRELIHIGNVNKNKQLESEMGGKIEAIENSTNKEEKKALLDKLNKQWANLEDKLTFLKEKKRQIDQTVENSDNFELEDFSKENRAFKNYLLLKEAIRSLQTVKESIEIVNSLERVKKEVQDYGYENETEVYKEVEQKHKKTIKRLELEKHLQNYIEGRIQDEEISNKEVKSKIYNISHLDDKLKTELITIVESYNLDSFEEKQYKQLARNLVESYYFSRDLKEELREHVEDEEEITPNQLGKKWFEKEKDKQPEGNVSFSVEDGIPIITFDNPKDYSKFSEKELKRCFESDGKAISSPNLNIFNEYKKRRLVLVAKRPTENKKTIRNRIEHEKQHILNHQLEKGFFKTSERDSDIKEGLKEGYINLISKMVNPSNINRRLKLNEVKDELLARIKGNDDLTVLLRSYSDITKTLKEGDSIEFQETILSISNKTKQLQNKVSDYKSIIKKRYSKEKDSLENPRDLIINYLYDIPFRQIPETLDKLIFYYDYKIEGVKLKTDQNE